MKTNSSPWHKSITVNPTKKNPAHFRPLRVLQFDSLMRQIFFLSLNLAHLRICSMICAGILFICKRNAQSYLNNQLLLAKCEGFRRNELREAEQLHKELRRDVEYKLPSLKKQLAVLDIEVSLYTSLHPHAE